jgi:hypothetical protein
MLRFEIESDRDVLVDGIGLLPAGKSVEVTDEALRDFELRNGVKLSGCNLPPFVKVTAVLEPAAVEDSVEETAE